MSEPAPEIGTAEIKFCASVVETANGNGTGYKLDGEKGQHAWLYSRGFPSCCGVAILHSAAKTSGYTSGLLRLFKHAFARLHSYGYTRVLYYTAAEEQEWLEELLQESGWYADESTQFRNPNSGNMLTLWHINLPSLNDDEDDDQ